MSQRASLKIILPGLLFLSAFAIPALADVSIHYRPEARLWVLSGGDVSYVVGVNERNELQHVYWGSRIWREQDWAAAHSLPQLDGVDPSQSITAEEYPAWGGARYYEPAFKVSFADGVRDLVLNYVSHEIHDNELILHAKDIRYDVTVDLSYCVFPEGVIRKKATVHNNTKQVMTVESAQSGVWYLPRGEGYRLSYLAGRWASETLLTQEGIHPGIKVLESRRGETSNQMNPWFAIDGPERATETEGQVWFGALGWSGSWKIAVEQTPYQSVRVTGGYNNFDFSYPLQPGESLSTPPFYAGMTNKGFGEASRIFYRFELAEILPERSSGRLRPVLYNSWEATYFDVNEDGQAALAEKAARIGVERFVMDDGWFGERNSSHAGLGDWTPNPKKFPNGLGRLIEKVNKLGMDFGLWVEPEMVNPDSNLYRAHPDWIINFPGRPRTEARNQLMLNMAREDVKEYIFQSLDKLLAKNDIKFLKWDLNRNFTEPGWPELPVSEQRKLWVQNTLNVYEIFDRLRAKHPALEIESCSSGGGRVDLGILTRVEQVWTSDNTEAFDRLRIQEGFSYAYTPKIMMSWITDVPNMNGRSTPLQYRALVAMMGSLGIGANLNKLPEADLAEMTKLIAYYKTIRATVQEGDLYRLFSPRKGGLTANQYVARDGKQSVLFAFLQAQQFRQAAPTLYLRGLDERAVYRIKSLDGKLIEKMDTASGAYLMHHGLNCDMKGDYDSTSIVLERAD